jgi:hypothetical protein
MPTRESRDHLMLTTIFYFIREIFALNYKNLIFNFQLYVK